MSDAATNTTTWTQDLQGRITRRRYADGSALNYGYENTTSRLNHTTDAIGQVTTYSYYLDNKLHAIAYTNATHATAGTNSVFDSHFDRLTSVSDDATGTATFTYGDNLPYLAYNSWPASTSTDAGKLVRENKSGLLGFASYMISRTYDVLGRSTGRSIDGASNQANVTYNALGRLTTTNNALGAFGYDYTTSTSDNISLMYYGDRSGVRTSYSYFPNAKDQHLQTIENLSGSNGSSSHFDYDYDATGNITKWTQQSGGQVAQQYSFEYDAADQLTTATLKDTSTQATLKFYGYDYDSAGNRTTEQQDQTITTSTYNSVNQLASASTGGSLRVSGVLSKPATVKINGNDARVAGTSFGGRTNVAAGTNPVSVTAIDGNGTATTNNYNISVGSAANSAYTYDFNGNMISDGTGRTFEWDAANRISAINYTVAGKRSEFSYDGLDNCVQIREIDGAAASKRNLVWCRGTNPCEERDENNNVTRQYFTQGEKTASGTYLYARDRNSSIREVVNAAGVVQGRYAYDLYGLRSVTGGAYNTPMGFNGMYLHAESGLNLTLHRVYSPNLGRWLQRDPIMERGGNNLYAFCGNNPVRWTDSEGTNCDTERKAWQDARKAVDEARKALDFQQANLDIQVKNTLHALGYAIFMSLAAVGACAIAGSEGGANPWANLICIAAAGEAIRAWFAFFNAVATEDLARAQRDDARDKLDEAQNNLRQAAQALYDCKDDDRKSTVGNCPAKPSGVV